MVKFATRRRWSALVAAAGIGALGESAAVGTELLQPSSVAWESIEYPALEYPPLIGLPTTQSQALDAAAELELPESSLAWASAPLLDPAFEPAQMAMRNSAPTRRRATGSYRRASAGAAQATAVAGLASMPYMIGDTGAGTCIGITGVLQAELSHPTLACGRLNIAEANSPLPRDRWYYSYRHFHNASPVSIFEHKEVVDYDRHVIANERTFGDGLWSVEARLPVEQRLTSDVGTTINESVNQIDPILGSSRETNIGNMAFIFKSFVWEGRSTLVSAGLGLTVPTAKDVDYLLLFQGDVTYASLPGVVINQLGAVQAHFDNETVYLEPFVAWAVAPPESRWFHQGFLQVEVAANASDVRMQGGGLGDVFLNNVFQGSFAYTTGDTPFTIETAQTKLQPQTLLRLNLGTGYRLLDDPGAPVLRGLAALAEVHYTTTLEDAELGRVPINFQPPNIGDFQQLSVGNIANRVDIVNAALGLTGDVSGWIVTNGFIAPVRQAPDRGFDFEYNVQVQRPY